MVVISFVGVILVADPLQAWSPTQLNHSISTDRSSRDGLPHDLVSKIIGIVLVLACALILGAESKSVPTYMEFAG